MIKFFRQSYVIQYVVIALLAIALWIPSFVSGKAMVGLGEPVTPIFNLVDGLLGGSPFLQHLVAFLLLVLVTLIFNNILVKNQIVGKVSTMGAFVFVLLMSLTQTQTNFYPFVLSVPFIILTISYLFDTYQIPNPEMNLLKAGACTALASMCYFPSILLVVWMLIAVYLVGSVDAHCIAHSQERDVAPAVDTFVWFPVRVFRVFRQRLFVWRLPHLDAWLPRLFHLNQLLG